MEQGDDAAPEWIGEYRVKRLLGRGGFGEVYLAANEVTGEDVAVKVFRPLEGNVKLAVSSRAEASGDEALRELRERFIAEARTLQGLGRVEAVVDVGHVGALATGEPYYVMPYLPESLADRVGQDVFERGAQAELPEGERPRALEYAEGVRILGQVLEGLSAAHGRGLVHRDVKPSNVLLDGEGNACVADFGIAKLPGSVLTEPGMGMGSRNYMAPEQRESARHVDARADVYSFGRLAYRVLVGRLPEGRYADPMELVPRMGRGLHELIVSCLKEQPDNRPSTAGEVLERWRSALAEGGRALAAGETKGVRGELGGETASGPMESAEPSSEKPLREEIVAALLARGDVVHVRGDLEILALAAGMDEAKLDRLIEQLREQHRESVDAVQALSRAVDRALSMSGGELNDQSKDLLLGGARARGLEERLDDLVAWRQTECWRQGGAMESATSAPSASGGRYGIDAVPCEAGLQPGDRFRDGPDCPEMVVLPAGSYWMGSPSNEEGRTDSEGPVHEVTIDAPLALGVYEVTFAEWDACVRDGGCGGYAPDDQGWGRGCRPVINVSWEDAQAYVEWLSDKTGQLYRLPSESEWEYAVRAGAVTPFHTGSTISADQANYDGNRGQTVPVGTFEPNAWGLHDMHGNVWEWVEDCGNDSYVGAPSDGSAWLSDDCSLRVLRGGSWNNPLPDVRAAARIMDAAGVRDSFSGFRVVRALVLEEDTDSLQSGVEDAEPDTPRARGFWAKVVRFVVRAVAAMALFYVLALAYVFFFVI